MNTDTPPELPPNGSLLDDLDFIDEPKAAIALDVGTQTLISYRKAGRGPEFILIGRRVLYSRAKLKQWLEAGGTRGIAEQSAGPRPAVKAKPRTVIKRKGKRVARQMEGAR